MRQFVLVITAFSLVACGGPLAGASPTEFCLDGAAAVCGKLFACASDEDRAMDWGEGYGTSEADCVERQRSACASIDDANACGANKRFDAASARAGLTEYRELSCEEWRNAPVADQRNIVDACQLVL